MKHLFQVCELTIDESKEIEEKLEHYDEAHVSSYLNVLFQLGIKNEKGKVIAGLFASGTAYHIVYVSTLYVDEEYRRQGLGTMLMSALEEKARQSGAKLIRLDTFDWQGREFYKALQYEEVGSYKSVEDNFSEHFFLKRL